MTFESRDEQFKTFVLMRKERWHYFETMIIARLKYLLIIFSSFLGGTGLYFHLHHPNLFSLLVTSWIMIFIGLIFLLTHFHLTIFWINKKFKAESDFYLSDVNMPSIQCLELSVNILPIITDFFFVLGILFFILFLSMSF